LLYNKVFKKKTLSISYGEQRQLPKVL